MRQGSKVPGPGPKEHRLQRKLLLVGFQCPQVPGREPGGPQHTQGQPGQSLIAEGKPPIPGGSTQVPATLWSRHRCPGGSTRFPPVSASRILLSDKTHGGELCTLSL